MAKKQMASLCYSAFVILTLAPFAFSRSMVSSERHEHYQELDVKASMARTEALFTLSPQRFQQEESEAVIPSSSLSFRLHPRSAIFTSKDEDYAAVTKSRVARDTARVDSLKTRLQLALQNFTSMDLNPVDKSLGSEAIQAPITSGATQGSGEYFTRIGVGLPVQEFYLVIDTGSDISWLQCQPCIDCYQQTDPVYNPVTSSTFRFVSCRTPQCNALRVSACTANTCQYQVSYGDGSYTIGDLATDTVSFGGGNTVANVALGCGNDNEGLFVGAAGLLGLGHGPLSFTSQLKATSFSYCLVDRDSTTSSTLEFNSGQLNDSVVAPLVRNSRMSTFFYVGLTGFSVGGIPVSIPASVFDVDANGGGGIIVDSGTAVTRLQSRVYNALRDSFVKLTNQRLPKTSGFALFDTCYDLSTMTTATVPTITFNFVGGKSLKLPAQNYLIPVNSQGKFCLAFAPTSGSLSIIGNIQQQGTRVSYDLSNNSVGFSPGKC